MLKPIVSMNTMAMNESIATTCCFVWNGTSYAGSASLPHGGKLVGSSSSTYYFKNANRGTVVSKGWLNYKYGHVVCGGTVENSAPYESGGKWYVGDALISSLPTTDVKPTAYCDHSIAANCEYEKVSSFSGMKHIGATSAHYTYTSGNNWLVDHTAYQYSS